MKFEDIELGKAYTFRCIGFNRVAVAKNDEAVLMVDTDDGAPGWWRRKEIEEWYGITLAEDQNYDFQLLQPSNKSPTITRAVNSVPQGQLSLDEALRSFGEPKPKAEYTPDEAREDALEITRKMCGG